MEKETGKIPGSLVALVGCIARSNQLVVRSKQPPDATASLRISTDGRGFFNVMIAIATALFMALHNSGMILIVLWDGISSPEGVYFHTRRDANP
ncbi:MULTISPECIES: hypothetical protein [unclassified Microcoleus]|uniref:hypothetical protein n=1 Tax=unclassified Microcoleus TaxID=2642155 RepID=UPI002FD5973B